MRFKRVQMQYRPTCNDLLLSMQVVQVGLYGTVWVELGLISCETDPFLSRWPKRKYRAGLNRIAVKSGDTLRPFCGVDTRAPPF